MPQEGYHNSIYSSPNKNEIISDRGLAYRKAEEAASRRYQAVQWLQQMDQVASEVLPKQPTEEEFCLALRNGLILCNVLNKVNPGAVHKVVDNPVLDLQAAQSAIQYFENMRNFLAAVAKMKLLTFGASDLEKGGSSGKVVDCILCLKGYYEWKQSGGIGVWKYGGTVRITSLVKESPSSVVSSESADESIDDSESSQYEQLMELLHLSTDSHEDSRAANILTFIFDHFALGLLQSCLNETNGFDDSLSSSMVIDVVLRKVVKDFSALMVCQGNQLGLFLKKVLSSDGGSLSKTQLREVISKYLRRRTSFVSQDISNFCICGGRKDGAQPRNTKPHVGVELLDIQQKQLEELKALFKETKREMHEAQFGWEKEIESLGQHVKNLEVAASSYHTVLEENRVLYNQVQDLKGSIRVYCRVRPFLSGDCNEQSTVDYIGDNGSIMIVNPVKLGKDARKVFTFNKVYGTTVTQQHIYADTQAFVRSVMDGFNVCIFAYGQTGSGKTYTMSGPDLTTEETWGVNYRALRDLFNFSKARMDLVEYEVGVQMVEIYNEQVRDLLVSDGSNRRLEIRNNSQLNGLNVPDASLVPVKCTQDVLDLMRIGQRNRAVGATALNVRSSRSHSILTVHVRGKELVSGSMLKGCLHLVDLAGSERVDKSEAVGERLKEAQHINKSLSALGDVIAALAQKSSHVPYRNSKLTQVLQDSLGQHAKTLMFVHINPEVNGLGETISTLKFAERVATINLGAAQSNKETGEIKEFKDEISNLKLVLERKEAELEQLKNRTNVRGGASPLRLPKSNSSASLKSETSQQQFDSHNTELRSCSTGKLTRSRLPSKFTDKDCGEDRPVGSIKPRSISTDRAAVMKSRTKSNALDNPPVLKAPFPASLSVNKSVANVPSSIQEPHLPNALNRLQRVSLQRVPENEDELFKQALSIRHGGIRKPTQEGKVKTTKQQASAKVHTSMLLSDVAAGKMQETGKSDSSEPENENSPFWLTRCASVATGSNKLHRSLSRNSQNVEISEISRTTDPSLGGYRDGKEAGQHSSVPQLRRSKSTTLGRFMI
ncbi:kinesin-like protein KIN-14F [Salvia splendens]|uniref:kinesin-like protein KIN-14F n=1 Tax=Salvia splendens TaxID=180675 RepID=UPI001C278847|nr:kinesin-like protein KIN-14F [Salvia splendens]